MPKEKPSLIWFAKFLRQSSEKTNKPLLIEIFHYAKNGKQCYVNKELISKVLRDCTKTFYVACRAEFIASLNEIASNDP